MKRMGLGERYADDLHKLRQAVDAKRPLMRNQTCFVLVDNTNVHGLPWNPKSSRIARQAWKDCNFVPLHIPPYSPDAAPMDHFVLPDLKNCQKGLHFDNDEEMEEWVNAHLEKRAGEGFYLRIIDSLIHQLNGIINRVGEYS